MFTLPAPMLNRVIHSINSSWSFLKYGCIKTYFGSVSNLFTEVSTVDCIILIVYF